jgi:hypothetical protein
LGGAKAAGAEGVFVELGEAAGGTAESGAETGKSGEWRSRCGAHAEIDAYTSIVVAPEILPIRALRNAG